MFAKVHKAGSTTTACILQRFGYEHNLTFVLPVRDDHHIGWPFFFKQEDILPSADGTYNVLVHHSVYHRQLLKHVMPLDTVYISILRHPLSHLRSVFNWYEYDKVFRGLKGPDHVASFLEDPKKFQIPYFTNFSDPMTRTKNFMAYELGFPVGLFDDQPYVDEFVDKISREFDLILILEHINESLILLRRLMCWTLKDMLYGKDPKRVRIYLKPTTNNATLEVKHRQWSNVDYQLYDYFNKTLWKKILQEDDDFHQEVRHFEQVLQSTTTYCENAIIPLVGVKIVKGDGIAGGRDERITKEAWVVNGTAGILTVPKSTWNDEFDIDPTLCLKLKMMRKDWDYVLKRKHKLPADVSESVNLAIKKFEPQTILAETLDSFNIK
ncbi:galactose-3-O-sulfotransferase 2-like [Branchiostoma floridae x Branchiostoma japonicum]